MRGAFSNFGGRLKQGLNALLYFALQRGLGLGVSVLVFGGGYRHGAYCLLPKLPGSAGERGGSLAFGVSRYRSVYPSFTGDLQVGDGVAAVDQIFDVRLRR